VLGHRCVLIFRPGDQGEINFFFQIDKAFGFVGVVRGQITPLALGVRRIQLPSEP
jgi:hypothetical protein